MPAQFDARDRQLVIGAVAVMFALLALTYFLRPAPAQQSIGIPSTYSAEWLGAKAAFLLLQESGYQVERWESPPNELPEDASGTTLIFAEPTERGSSAERASVSRFVSNGGRLLVMGAAGANFAPLSSAIPIPDSDLTPKPFTPAVPSPLSRNAPEVTMVAPDQWKTLAPGQISIYERQGKTGAVWYRYGKGEVIWWAISSPASNGSIREKGNLALLLNSVGPPGSRILWDEYFHGMRRSLGSYFAATPLPWAGAQLAFLFLIILFTFSRRSGPMRPLAVESRLSALEFVDTLGSLYQSAQAAPAAVEIAYQRLRLALARRLSIPVNAKLPALCEAAEEHLGWQSGTLFNTLSDAERAMRDINLENGEALDLVRGLHGYLHRLETQRKPAEERTSWK
ncbi:MAG: DUF4350 domain-containing protein [Acidobacteriia bacterium]|nr:DUF4350 domain-containing protein [Terriglobia bacterium]